MDANSHIFASVSLALVSELALFSHNIGWKLSRYFCWIHGRQNSFDVKLGIWNKWSEADESWWKVAILLSLRLCLEVPKCHLCFDRTKIYSTFFVRPSSVGRYPHVFEDKVGRKIHAFQIFNKMELFCLNQKKVPDIYIPHWNQTVRPVKYPGSSLAESKTSLGRLRAPRPPSESGISVLLARKQRWVTCFSVSRKKRGNSESNIY